MVLNNPLPELYYDLLDATFEEPTDPAEPIWASIGDEQVM
jgi:hypothetical protein